MVVRELIGKVVRSVVVDHDGVRIRFDDGTVVDVRAYQAQDGPGILPAIHVRLDVASTNTYEVK